MADFSESIRFDPKRANVFTSAASPLRSSATWIAPSQISTRDPVNVTSIA
jgi:hypothetical protein